MTLETDSRRTSVLARLVLVLVLVVAAACSDDDSSGNGSDGGGGDDPDDNAEEVAESAAARVVAEALRVVLLADDGPATDRRQVAVLQESVDDIPGRPDVSGIADDDDDGLDDDGKVEVRVDDEVACLTVAEDGDVDVTGGAC